MFAIIGGTSLLESTTFEDMNEEVIQTQYGGTTVLVNNKFVYVQRHGQNADIPPHKINHKANITALYQMGITKAIAVNSTGSLKKAIKPGALLIPDDYFNLFDIPTFFDSQLRFTIPGLDHTLRNSIIAIARRNNINVIPKGVYFQVQGPTLETRAEIQFIKEIGDVVGMTLAKEAILAKEMQIGYASICMVDNYANGINPNTPLTLEEIGRMRDLNRKRIESLLGLICSEMANE